MSDFEHELLVEARVLRDQVAVEQERLRKAVATAIGAQEAAFGIHDAWLDDELARVSAA